MSKKFVLIDGKSVFYRGYYAMPNLTTMDGTPVGGVYGFASMAIEIIDKLKPDYVAVAWDKSKTNIASRVKIYPQYKANRKPAPPDFYAQIPILKDLLSAFGWPLYEMDNYEADDIMGSLAKQSEAKGIESIMISSDLDMLQLLDNDTHLYALKKGLTHIEKFDIPAFEAKYGIKIGQFLDLKALKGDASDNVPGVPGIGEKTATILLQEFESLDNIYANLDKIKPAWATKLSDGKDSAYMSRELGKIWCDAPIKLDLSAIDTHNLDAGKLCSELKKLEFNSLIKRLPDYMRCGDTDDGVDKPGLYYVQKNGNIIINDAKVLFKKLLAEGKPLPKIEFDTRIAGFLLGRVQPVSSVDDLKKTYKSQITAMDKIPKLKRLAKQLDFPLQNLLAEIEQRGVRIDTKKLAKMSDNLATDIAKIETEIFELAGEEFNIASPQQLSVILFNKLRLPTGGIKKNRNGYSTGRAELDKLIGMHPIIAKIGDYRELAKLKNTYVDALPKLVDENSYLHTNFRQDVTATGRLSSSDPNLQNIPVRSQLGQAIRYCFIASPGKVLVSADYSQFELRLAAALANDKNLIADFDDDNIDVHTKTAAEAYNITPDKVTPDQRRNAKVINFGVLYGISPHGLVAATGMSYSSAKEFIERYFAVRQPIRDFIEATIKKAEDDGYVETLFGRRRPTPDVKAHNYMIRESAKRAAANMPIQGTEADLMKMAMLKIDEELGDIAPQILQIHDSIMVECDPEDVGEVSSKMKDIMENIYPKLGVRLKVDIKSGKSWGKL